MMTKSHPQIGFHPAPIHTNIKLASIMLTLFLFPFLCHVTMPEEEYTPGKYSIIPLMVPHSILIHTCFYVFIKARNCNVSSPIQCKLDHVRIPRQSLCRQFQIICGFFNSANPTFRMYAVYCIDPEMQKVGRRAWLACLCFSPARTTVPVF